MTLRSRAKDEELDGHQNLGLRLHLRRHEGRTR
jgi:hypothetical protein